MNRGVFVHTLIGRAHGAQTPSQTKPQVNQDSLAIASLQIDVVNRFGTAPVTINYEKAPILAVL